MENRKEFGLRSKSVEASAAAKETVRNFEKDRPMYERLRHTDATMDSLLTRHDEMRAFQESGHGTSEDIKELERNEEEIAERLRELSNG